MFVWLGDDWIGRNGGKLVQLKAKVSPGTTAGWCVVRKRSSLAASLSKVRGRQVYL